MISFLSEIPNPDLCQIGGKAAQLSQMIGAGLPVPDGLVLSTDLYRRFIDANQLQSQIEQALQRIQQEPEQLQDISRPLRQILLQASVPKNLADTLRAAYLKLEAKAVVVRSSATAEDLPGSSFAGQYDTFLNVQGEENLLLAVQKCWASLWNERALAYRLKSQEPTQDLAHAVVIQPLIECQSAGVLFTAHPGDGRRDQMLLTSSWGLGESVVAGNIEPDRWVLDGISGEVLEQVVGSK